MSHCDPERPLFFLLLTPLNSNFFAFIQIYSKTCLCGTAIKGSLAYKAIFSGHLDIIFIENELVLRGRLS